VYLVETSGRKERFFDRDMLSFLANTAARGTACSTRNLPYFSSDLHRSFESRNSFKA